MRKIYQKYFEIPEENKGIMGEHVFFARLAVSIACIVLCMSAMGFSAYAYFTASVSSSMNQIQAANFAVRPEIALPTGSGSAAHVQGTAWKYTLKSGIYDITLNKEGTASTGYCEIKIGNNSFYTGQIGGVKDTSGNEIVARTIRIEIKKDDTVIEITSCWGSYSGTPIDETQDAILVDSDLNATLKNMYSTTTMSEEPETTTQPATSPKDAAASQSTTSTDNTTLTEDATKKEDTSESSDSTQEKDESNASDNNITDNESQDAENNSTTNDESSTDTEKTETSENTQSLEE